MENKVSLILKIAAAAISIITIILWVMTMGEANPEVGGMLSLTYFLLGVTAVSALIFPIVSILISGEFKKLAMSIGGAAALLAIFGISYSMSEDTIVNGIVESGSRASEAGLMTAYILIVISIIAILAGSVKKLIS